MRKKTFSRSRVRQKNPPSMRCSCPIYVRLPTCLSHHMRCMHGKLTRPQLYIRLICRERGIHTRCAVFKIKTDAPAVVTHKHICHKLLWKLPRVMFSLYRVYTRNLQRRGTFWQCLSKAACSHSQHLFKQVYLWAHRRINIYARAAGGGQKTICIAARACCRLTQCWCWGRQTTHARV